MDLMMRRRALMGILGGSESDDTIVDDGSYVVRYDVTDITTPTKLLINTGNAVLSMKIDGVLQDNIVTEYQFNKVGKHEVRFYVNVNERSNISFQLCTDVTLIYIPNGIIFLTYAFCNKCTKLEKVIFPDSITDLSKMIFNGCTSLTQVTIPNGSTNIPEGAFSGCESLLYLELPSSVTAIGLLAFQKCNALSLICRPTTPPTCDELTFRWNNTGRFFVPDESVEAYKTAAYWSDLASRIYPISEYVPN